MLLNLMYGLVLIGLAPWMAIRAALTGRYRQGLADWLLGTRQLPQPVNESSVAADSTSSNSPPDQDRPVVWFHGVSVGEVALLGVVVAAFRKRHPDWRVIISCSTETGLTEARKRFADLTVIRFPFDFTWAIRRVLTLVQPRLIVLAESELWPNFLRQAQLRSVPVVVINARMSPRSFKRFSMLRWILRPLLLSRITGFAAQSETYAEAYRKLGVPADRVTVTGSVKYDGAKGDRHAPEVQQLRRAFAVQSNDLIWVAGSTHAPEESLVLESFRVLKERHRNLRLILVPRSVDRFNAVAELIRSQGFTAIRRSQMTGPLTQRAEVILIDTIGELGAVWGLAHLAFVGGTFDGRRGGQSMIEPAAYGMPIVLGPSFWNFRDAVIRLQEVGAARVVPTPAGLTEAIRTLLDDPIGRERMSQAARQLVRDQQGATERTLRWLDRIVEQSKISKSD
ncbi:3-deoxy-D-manno-octulosonic acid transferase [Tuwongella immobilis]|uniref:3-deoxy-D-manno-octulosonic acid transferase n=1 Tax=Tuwongella immobilis TaxID=692036 RepID=A0A6C2YUU1_9BACT|nr:3-deoxy-D-manno-octulosonic acid transferase [Tuwongella immobilis]VIP04685.1 Three-deoxy-D-manno-octulosonic-acid transferase domain-containing protein OS=Isosphaera pallida (strain ATCC 43644 / DSM 9630 / IS1B) GN=Isop_2778 PE=4 SV=1: Glycos_transf_N [Tuwongella immobilis]VTS06729.1 Three-deoxy-D-manno-octulosonic-acid transferase domain-containing protein OS=Isosphaera pallida (strain ATCC 43644 / DSM 9630 / IS1B) GN=Isop_2778 PE=4 SV=1: Glycos_transf_N [Tuwongella immobilis]